MSKQKVKVPDSLRDVLLEFSIAYLLEQPGDVIDFAVDFFTKLQTNRAQTGIGIGITKPTTPDESIQSQDEGESANFHANRMQILWSVWRSRANNIKFISFSAFVPVQTEEPVVNRFAGRRKSVFAEQYDPEEDEDDNNKVIFPKTDEQRTRLCDSVKNILLFRALDPEQVRRDLI